MGAAAVRRAHRPDLAVHVIPDHTHVWHLRDVEYADGREARRFECDGCGGVDFA